MRDSGFVELGALDSSIVIDLVYATANNFTNNIIYPAGVKAYLQRPAAEALVKVNQSLLKDNVCLKVWDAYRPFSMQEKLWSYYPDEKYLMKPVRDGDALISGSRHSRGVAVDLTLFDLKKNQVFEMPTAFDDFSEKAHRSCFDLSELALKNRQYLEDVMAQYGFVGHEYEWWHFDWGNADGFPLCDFSLL